jgi:dTDP-4-dehydrorhamnose reductase
MITLLIGDGILGSSIKKRNSSIFQLTKKDVNLLDSVEDIYNALNNEFRSVLRGIDSVVPGLPPPKLCIINAAAYTDVDGAEIDKALAFACNAAGAYKVALACKRLNAHLLHISTDFVFDGRKNTPYDEYDVPAPINAYGLSKLYGEKMIQNSGCNYTIVRTGWLYNDDQGIVPNLIKAIKNDKHIRGIEDQLFAPTHATSLAEQLDRIRREELYGTFHATSLGKIRPYELIEYLMYALYDKKVSVDRTNMFSFFNERAHRPCMCLLKNMNLTALGLDCMPPWQTDVDKLLEKTVASTIQKDSIDKSE